jgi:ribonuclease Z
VLQRAAAVGAGALVHTVIKKDLVASLPQQRIRDICDYHSSVEEAAATAARAGVGTLVLTHYVPPIGPGQAVSGAPARRLRSTGRSSWVATFTESRWRPRARPGG